MNSVKVKCAYCGKEFSREKARYNEAKKKGWNQYCSSECLSKDREKKKIMICENCGKTFQRTPSDISPHNYCSKSCAITANNEKGLTGRAKKEPEMKTCENCGKEFRKSTGNRKYCSRSCSGETRQYTPEKIIKIIRTTAEELGRTPTKRECSIYKTAERLFGTWNSAIIAADLEPNRSHNQQMYKRSRTKASDGHSCDSISELIIDNWLTENKISHQVDVLYPKTKHKADWSIETNKEKVFVEYFGLAGDSPRYDRNIKKKKKLCQKHEIKLIEIYPRDIYPQKNLNDNLKDKFKELID